MRKRLAILVVLLGFIGVAYSQVLLNEAQEKQPVPAKDDKAASFSKPCTCIVQVQDSTPKQAEKPKREPYQWRDLYAPANVPNWFLFAAALWAGFMALRTLKAIEKQTNLQTVAYTQWVKIENWEATARMIEPAERIPYGEVEIGFDIVNGSDFPLTMKEANIVFAGNTTFNSGDDVFLAPHAPYRVKVAVQITKARFNTWEQAIIDIPIRGDIPHLGVLRNLAIQSFKGLLIVGRDTPPRFQYEISMVPTEKSE